MKRKSARRIPGRRERFARPDAPALEQAMDTASPAMREQFLMTAQRQHWLC